MASAVQTGTVAAPGASLHYHLHGPPLSDRDESDEIPHFVLLHGFTSTGKAQWGRRRIRFLHEAFDPCRLLVPDIRGHGGSRRDESVPQPPGVPHSTIGEDLGRVIDGLGFAPAHFIGFSSGGVGMLYLVLSRPDLFKSLTLISTSTFMDEDAAAVVRRMRNSQSEPWYAEMVAELDYIHREGQGPGYGERVLDLWLPYGSPPPDPNLALEDLRGIDMPTLIVHGDRDLIFPLPHATRMQAAIPGATLKILPDCGHRVRTPESQSAMEQAILEFLSTQL